VLFLATAILSASIHFAGVVEVPAAPAAVATSLVEPRGASIAEVVAGPQDDVPVPRPAPVVDELAVCRALAATEPTSTTGSLPTTAAADLTAPACLAELAGASSTALAALGDSFDPDGDDASRLAAVLTAGADGPSTAAWWGDLDGSRQLALVADLPGVVGQLEGVPYAVRDQANRLFLSAATLALHVRDETAGEQPGDDARAAMLGQVQAALADRSAADDVDRQLVALDTVMPGRAAVVVGDLDTADDVSVLVPGMFFTVSGQMVDWAETAAELHDEQRAWTYLLARSDARPLDTVAVVAWMGYRTPDLTNVYTLDLARQGAAHLEDALGGLDAARASDAPRVTVVAHSYGSTTATLALSSGRVRVDSLALLGSPGSVVSSAGMLSVADHDVYAAAGSFDPVAGSGFFGADPGTGDFGAVLMHTGGGADTVTGRALGAALGHNDYLRPGTESMRSLALIALGHGDMVVGDERGPGEPRPDGPELVMVRPQDVYLRD
jgi:pimeloyl-ACP methyl ester carboxylesterase